MPPPIADELGRMIQVARKAKGLTQTQLGEKLGLSQPWVSGVELGEIVHLDVVLAARLAEALGLKLVKLVHAATLRSESHKRRADEKPLDVARECPDEDSPISVEPMSLPDSSAA